jgi:hypothetical protein
MQRQDTRRKDQAHRGCKTLSQAIMAYQINPLALQRGFSAVE